ncbi:single-stranded DNA-binding protein [Humibacillus xanthopallidus]|uniref:Single-strand DNA-binding protein n=1 Tax=Humibacillus xanthopallidus TaxID=412689 RepID=A0A543HIM0_9MICO|nr:single-stranded DNA-binding protein [Humibacillus xanthopallidus]TQM58140.1 single-strand DNA-binding protein [Humibacillus xanthopallidus]
MSRGGGDEPGGAPALNEVALRGRASAPGEERTLPSGDVIVTLRVIVSREGAAARRATGGAEVRRAPVDTIDVVCWTARTRRAALRLAAGDGVEVGGALRRRFYGGPAGRQSRYEVEAASVRRVARGAPVAS